MQLPNKPSEGADPPAYEEQASQLADLDSSKPQKLVAGKRRETISARVTGLLARPQGTSAQQRGASAQEKSQPGDGGEPSGGGEASGEGEQGGRGGLSLKGAGAATAAGVVATKAALVGVGFGSAGITGGSIAAGIQAGIGNVAAGSTFAVLQSMGAGAVMGWAAPGAAVGFGAYLGYKAVKKAYAVATEQPPAVPNDGGDGIEYPTIETLLWNLRLRAAGRGYPPGARPDYRSYAPLLHQHGFYHVDSIIRHTPQELAATLQLPLGLAGDIHEEAARLVEAAKKGKAPIG